MPPEKMILALFAPCAAQTLRGFFCRWCWGLLGEVAAVDGEEDAGGPAGFFAEEIGDAVGDIGRVAVGAHRDAAAQLCAGRVLRQVGGTNFRKRFINFKKMLAISKKYGIIMIVSFRK